MSLKSPMRTEHVEMKSGHAPRVDANVTTSRHDGPLPNKMIFFCRREYSRCLRKARPIIWVDLNILFPAQSPSARQEEMFFITWEVLDPKLFVGHAELASIELLYVWHAFALYVAGAPAGVDELPFTVVDLDGVPGVTCVVWWEW